MNTAALDRIINRHNPENDTRRDGPDVTWAEVDLALFVLDLVAKVEKLEKQLAAMQQPINTGGRKDLEAMLG